MSKCYDAIFNEENLKRIFGEEGYNNIPKKFINQWVDGAEKIRKAYEAGHIPKEEMLRGLDNMLEVFRLNAEAKALIAVKNTSAIKSLMDRVNSESFKQNPIEAFRSYLTKTFLQGNDAKVGLETTIRSRIDKYISPMEQALKEVGGLNEFRSGLLDEHIANAYLALESGVDIAPHTPQKAIDIAKALKETNDIMYHDMHTIGLPVQRKSGRLTMQTHDIRKIRAMGEDNWVALVKKLSPDKKFLPPDAHSPEGMDKLLREMYQDILLGRHSEIDVNGSLINVTEGIPNSNVGSSKIGTRTLNFDAAGTLEYMQKAGKYGTLAETVLSDITNTAHKTTLFDFMGDNPSKTLNKAITQKVAGLKKEGKIDLANKLEGSRGNLSASLDRVSGSLNIPASEALAKLERSIGAAEATSKLGATGIRSASNIANSIITLKNASGDNWLQSAWGAVSSAFKEIPQAVRAHWMSEAGDYLDVVGKELNSSIQGGGIPGLMTKMANFAMKWNGLEGINRVLSDSIILKIQKDWGKKISSGASFDSLHPGTQADLLASGIDKHIWNEVMPYMVETASNGDKVLSLESLSRKNMVPKEALQKVMALKGLKTTEDKLAIQIELGLRSYFEQISDIATTTPGARESAALMGNTQAGTLESLIRGMAVRFKSFTAQAIFNTRAFNAMKVDPQALKLGQVISTGNNYQNIAALILFGVTTAYLADSLIRIGQGKDIRDPTDVGTWLDAMGKSSAGGLYMDVFNGQWDKYSYSQTLLGPTLGQVAPLMSAASHIKNSLGESNPKKAQKERSQAAMDAVKIVRSYVPFQQAVGVKQIVDYAQWDIVHKGLFSEQNRRWEQKKARERLKKQLGGE